jgi:hypothetical protein
MDKSYGKLPPTDAKDIAQVVARSLEKRLGEIDGSIRACVDWIRRDLEWIEKYPEAPAAAGKRGGLPKQKADLARLQESRSRVASAIETVRLFPTDHLLPVGAFVRFVRPPFRAHETYEIPTAGAEAIVAGPALDGAGTVRVAISSPYRDTKGVERAFDGNNVSTVSVDVADVEVVAPGFYLDGRVCEALNFVPTHDNQGRFPEMLVESAGRVWRFEPTENGRSMYPPAAHDDPSELDYLEDARTGEPVAAPAASTSP